MREVAVDVQHGRRTGLDLGCSVVPVVEGGKPLEWEDLRHTMEGVEGSTTTGEDMVAVTAEVAVVTMEGAGAEVASGTIDLPGSKTTTGTRTGAEEGTGEDLHTEGLHLQGAGRHQDHLAGRLPHPHLEWEGPHPLHRRTGAEGGVEATECLLLETTTSTPHHLRRHREEEGLEGLHPHQEIQDTLRTEEEAGPDLCHRPLEPRPQARREEEDKGRPQGLRRAHPRLDGAAGGEAVPAGAPRPRPHPRLGGRHLVVGQGTISAL